MPQRLSRRRYAEVVKFLKATVKNERLAHKIRFRAAERLIEVYTAHDRAVERSEAARTKPRCNSTPIDEQTQEGAITPQESALEDEANTIAKVFAEAMKPRVHDVEDHDAAA
ncbi:MAG: hypothetical protein V4555_05310 [Acidobacteriota bacterium]